jgi:hypothetical protein
MFKLKPTTKESAHEKLLDEILSVGIEVVREGVLERLDLLESKVLGLASERRRARDELVKNTPDCPKVGTVRAGERELQLVPWTTVAEGAGRSTYASVVRSFSRTSGLTYSAVPTNDRFGAGGMGLSRSVTAMRRLQSAADWTEMRCVELIGCSPSGNSFGSLRSTFPSTMG